LKTLLYAAKSDEKTKRLKSLLAEVVGEENIEGFDHFHDLVRCFCKPRPADGLTIGVFAAADLENLRQLASIRNLTVNLRIILVLPDRSHETVAEGHKLQPRFVTYSDSDFKEIGAVVGKMMESEARVAPNRN
jgi:hypothetical protein